MELTTGAVLTDRQNTAGREGRVAPPPPGVRRRAGRTAAFGLLLAVAGALAFAVVDLRADPASAVLTVARPVAAGEVIIDADLSVARIVPDAGVAVLSENQRSSVVGHTAAVPLLAGTLLSPKQLGAPAWPPRGQSVVAVAIKAGHAPAGLTAGSPVTVLVVPTSGGSGSGGPDQGKQVQERATVVTVSASNTSGVTVVSLLLTSSAALKVGSATGDVSLILQSAGG
jgi:hypothetical protein